MVHSPDRTYALRVSGNGLHEEMISEGDLLLVEAREVANAGETVIALINQHDHDRETILSRGRVCQVNWKQSPASSDSLATGRYRHPRGSGGTVAFLLV